MLIERGSTHPLLPLRIVLDRTRGGAYLSIGIAGAGLFGVFLFLTYYLQQTLGFSPIQTGLAFLPMSAAIIVTATTAHNPGCCRALGPRPLVMTGMALGAVAMLAFFAQLTPSTRPTPPTSCPGLLVHGRRPRPDLRAGVRAPRRSASTATTPASPRRWSTPASRSAARSAPRCSARSSPTARHSYASSHARSPGLAASAAVHGYTTAFYFAAILFAIGFLVAALVLPRRIEPQRQPAGELATEMA